MFSNHEMAVWSDRCDVAQEPEVSRAPPKESRSPGPQIMGTCGRGRRTSACVQVGLSSRPLHHQTRLRKSDCSAVVTLWTGAGSRDSPAAGCSWMVRVHLAQPEGQGFESSSKPVDVCWCALSGPRKRFPSTAFNFLSLRTSERRT